MISRRQFLACAATATVRLKADTTDTGRVRLQPDQRVGTPRGSEFVFARLRYDSGDWDYNPKVAANVLDSVEGGPPQTSHELNGWGDKRFSARTTPSSPSTSSST